MIVDMEKIKALDAYEVGRDLCIIEFKGSRKDRMGWVGEEKGDDYSYLQFYDGGSYFDHRRGEGGTAIDLVMQSLHPSKSKCKTFLTPAIFTLASHYNLMLDPAPFREKAEKLAGVKSHFDRPTTYISKSLQSRNEKGGVFTSQNEEAEKLWNALEIEPSRVTLAAQSMSNAAALCWQPAVPWQGKANHQKYDEDRDQWHDFGGWSKDLATAHIGEKESLKIIIVDLDGASRPLDVEKKDWDSAANVPSFNLTQRLVSDLTREGFIPRAHVISSWGEDQSRCKSHLYFVCSRAARNVDEFMRWHLLLRAKINSLWPKWKEIPKEESCQFQPDECTDQITRLVRIPGFAKTGKQYAGVVLHTNIGAVVDFSDMLETQDCVVNIGTTTYTLGKICKKVEEKLDKDGMPVPKINHFGRRIWPLQVYQNVEDAKTGVRFRYDSRTGKPSYGTMCASAFNNKNDGRKHCAEATSIGVHLLTGSGNLFSAALGHWSDQDGCPRALVTTTPGWHEDESIYVNGDRVHGAQDWYPDEQSDSIQRRSKRKGNLSAWRAGIESLVTTNGIKAALGLSLAGSLVGLLGLSSFTLHLCGDSSKGKSCAARVAASVWGSEASAFNSWDSTPTALQAMAQTFSGACLVLDEFDKFKARDESAVGDIMYTIGGDKGRLRSNRDGTAQTEKSWKLTALSTGEISGSDRLGDMEKGGHKVRFIDLFVEDGDLATSKTHAEKLEQFAQEQYGYAGDVWVTWLLKNQEKAREVYEFWREQGSGLFVGDSEGGRIFNNIALIFTALQLSEEAGLTQWIPDEISNVMEWMLKRMGDREKEGTPNERGVNLFYRWLWKDPSRFPLFHEREKHRNVVAYRYYEDGDKNSEILITNKALIEGSGLAQSSGIKPVRWLSWCERGTSEGGGGFAEKKRISMGKKRAMFYVMPEINPLDEEEEIEEEEQGELL